ncbi:MAG TPA: hypothetical protein VFE16_05060 [Candidatus Cybelea sp.]|nr:hypothetical protein [Candidatus Cybelea sp.]
MLIRHAEKQPDDPPGPPPHGVNADGVQSKHSLIVHGWQRAGALVRFFCEPSGDTPIEPPDWIYATKVDANPTAGDDSKSRRPQETVTPLALALDLPVNTPYVVGEEAQVAAEIASRSGVVLVAWEHKHIPLITAALGAHTPSVWPDDRFDMVWVLTPHGERYHFAQVNQSLLAGDAATD